MTGARLHSTAALRRSRNRTPKLRASRSLWHCARVWLDPLEPRVLLSTYTVTNLNDSGAGSLGDALQRANANVGADTINFRTGLSGTIALGGTQLEVSDDLIIEGPDASALTISG